MATLRGGTILRSMQAADTEPTDRRAGIVGLGLIGGSVGLALRKNGWHVVGADVNSETLETALSVGAIDVAGDAADAEITFIATPVGVIADAAQDILARGTGLVTDVGSVKGPIVAAIDHPRFVAGHPMAGSEHSGVTGSRHDLFHGAVWVLAPTPNTDDATYADVRAIVASFGADVVAIDAGQHDRLVAVVSHVPHLTAASLMALADSRAVEHRALLRLAAGGFRDMTRIAAGDPEIWPDICMQNSGAIVGVLDEFIAGLVDLRQQVADHDADALLVMLERARVARVNLPTSVPPDLALAELRVPIADRPGELARITRLATEIDVNIYDIEIAHSVEGEGGVVILIVSESTGERLVGALMAHQYRPSIRPVESS